MHSFKLLLAISVFFIAAIVYWVSSTGDSFKPGLNFETETAWDKFIDEQGYVVVGKFNLLWPSQIESISRAKNEISLAIPGYGNQVYPGFTGYQLAGIVLKRRDGAYSGYVLRSKNKLP